MLFFLDSSACQSRLLDRSIFYVIFMMGAGAKGSLLRPTKSSNGDSYLLEAAVDFEFSDSISLKFEP